MLILILLLIQYITIQYNANEMTRWGRRAKSRKPEKHSKNSRKEGRKEGKWRLTSTANTPKTAPPCSSLRSPQRRVVEPKEREHE